MERQRGYPVTIHGTVTEYDVFRCRGVEFPNLFVHDGVAGIYVLLGDRRFPELKPGDVVDLTGRTGQYSGTAIVRDPSVRVLRHGVLPAPARSSFQELHGGLRFGDWVEVRGAIRYAYAEGSWVTMDLQMDGGVVEVLLPDRSSDEHPPDLTALVGQRVSIQATVAESLIQSRPRLYVSGSGRAHIRVDPPLQGGAVLPKRLSLLQIRQPRGLAAWGDRILTSGVITYQNGTDIVIEDVSAGLLTSTRENQPPFLPGDRVEVMGYLTESDAASILTYCSFRKIGSGPPLPVPRFSAQTVVGEEMNAQMIKVVGSLTGTAYNEGRLQLLFDEENVPFTVELAREGIAEPVMVPGSVWKMTGVAMLQRGRQGARAHSFRLMMQSDKDLVLVEPASLLTSSHLRYALGVSVALILATASGILVLRRKVRMQTATIRERLVKEVALEQRYRDLFENANDPVFSYDLTGRLITINAAGRKLLGYSTSQFAELNFLDLVVPEQRETMRQRIKALGSGIAAPPFEV
ncbi:MAG: PAS domain S-box protein, partial [Bryobacteraceae bacterium]